MPPRYAYWTILVDNQPTAFRAGSMEDLMPTFKRLKVKQPTAVMMWFQNGKLWNSRLDAQEAMRARGERGRQGDERQGGGFRDRKRSGSTFSHRSEERRPIEPRSDERRPLEWKPKGSFTPAPPRDRESTCAKSFKPKSFRPAESHRLEWKPRPKDGDRPRMGDRPRSSERARSTERTKLGWKPKAPGGPPRQDQAARPARRDKNWRPGGEHKDPRQKYKDAKKAKWQRFKSNIRSKWEAKKGGTSPARPKPRGPRKRRDDD